MSSQGKRMVNEKLIAILKEMDSKGISIADLADVLDAFASGEVQEKLTPGDNISISEENVISATDTKYTAGDNITITDGVISASGGDVWESVVNITVATAPTTQTVNVRLFTKEEITNNNVRDIIKNELVGSLKEIPCWSDDIVISIGATSGVPFIISAETNSSGLKIQFLKSDFTRTYADSPYSPNNAGLYIYYSHKLN